MPKCYAKRATALASRPAVRSQKARGVIALAQDSRWHVPPFRLLQEPPNGGSEWASAELSLPTWARPCPVKPRHGFVDSRRCETRAELERAWAEAIAADPFAELLVMRQIDAVSSAILAPGLLVLGPSNDGATSGHDSLSLPIRDALTYADRMLTRAGITQAPYLEVVVDETGTPHAVQLRDGLPCTRDADFVPQAMEVNNVVELDHDPAKQPNLLEWPVMVANFAPGTAVYQPGGSMASHQAMHCRQEWEKGHCVPILFTRRPVVGETLKVTKISPAFKPQMVLRGLAMGLAHPMPPTRAVHLVLFALHNSDGLAWRALGSLVLGAGIASTIRLGLIAGYGEARHAHKQGKDVPQGSRDSLYTQGWTHPTDMKRS